MEILRSDSKSSINHLFRPESQQSLSSILLIDNTKAVIMWPFDIFHTIIHRILDYFLAWRSLVSFNDEKLQKRD